MSIGSMKIKVNMYHKILQQEVNIKKGSTVTDASYEDSSDDLMRYCVTKQHTDSS